MNKRTEFGLRILIYTATIILLILIFNPLKKLIVQNTSVPYWVGIVDIKTAIICFFILIVLFL